MARGVLTPRGGRRWSPAQVRLAKLAAGMRHRTAMEAFWYTAALSNRDRHVYFSVRSLRLPLATPLQEGGSI